jgi:hypothetical protein
VEKMSKVEAAVLIGTEVADYPQIHITQPEVTYYYYYYYYYYY